MLEKLFKEFSETIIGIKESEGNLFLTKSILKTVPGCKVFVGKEKQIPEAVSYGGSGTICGMANLWPEIICSLYETGEAIKAEEMFLILENHPFITSCKALLSKKKASNWHLVRPLLVFLSKEESNLLNK